MVAKKELVTWGSTALQSIETKLAEVSQDLEKVEEKEMLLFERIILFNYN